SRPERWSPSGKLGGVNPPRQDSRAALDPRRGPGGSVVVGPEPIGSQPAPQRGTADTEPSRRLGQLAVRHLERVEDGLAFALGQGLALSAVRQKHHFTEPKGALLQGAGSAAELNGALAQALAPQHPPAPCQALPFPPR